jgi:hypothetical protein
MDKMVETAYGAELQGAGEIQNTGILSKVIVELSERPFVVHVDKNVCVKVWFGKS